MPLLIGFIIIIFWILDISNVSFMYIFDVKYPLNTTFWVIILTILPIITYNAMIQDALRKKVKKGGALFINKYALKLEKLYRVTFKDPYIYTSRSRFKTIALIRNVGSTDDQGPIVIVVPKHLIIPEEELPFFMNYGGGIKRMRTVWHCVLPIINKDLITKQTDSSKIGGDDND